VTSRADLALFPDVSDEWKEIPAADLIPRGCRADDWAFQVFDSGGTTGRPKRVVEATSRREGVKWVSEVLDRHGVPAVDGGNWLHIGPTGPHIVGRSVGLLAQLRRSLCFFIDFDPRWVKRCVRGGDTDSVVRYVDHVLDQAMDVLHRQQVTVVFLTPPLLEAICQRPAAYNLLAEHAKAIIWAGTSMSAETLRLVEDDLFPDTAVVGLYGNTLMGIAPQRPRRPDDDQPCVFQSFHPTCTIELVDPADTERPVPYGERGQVKFSLVSRDMFVPNCLERDTGIRVPPVAGFDWDGVAQVEPLPGTGSEVVVGVY
jgi:acyl-coenzyme A synthetase/AMP-(fatty) acid ligase